MRCLHAQRVNPPHKCFDVLLSLRFVYLIQEKDIEFRLEVLLLGLLVRNCVGLFNRNLVWRFQIIFPRLMSARKSRRVNFVDFFSTFGSTEKQVHV